MSTKVIRRFDLEVEPIQKLSMPYNAEFLSIGAVGSKPCLFFECPKIEERHAVDRTFVLLVQGKDIPQYIRYLGKWHYQAEVGHHDMFIYEV